VAIVQRLKNTGNSSPSRPNGSLLAGVIVGTVIITIATQAMALGIGAAILKGR
jgi:hypothetical protein